MLSSSIPLFPLPTVVLFPNVLLPLHIFEPRYRQMVSEALTGNRMIGMVMLRPGYEADYEDRPPVFNTGCSGLITHSDLLEDGRYNLVLRGVAKFTIAAEEFPTVGRLYRSAVINLVDEAVAAVEREELRRQRRRLEALLAPLMSGVLDRQLPREMPDEDLINTLAQYLEFDPIEKLALLEREGPVARCRAMIELLEMQAIRSRSGDPGSAVH
jgi:Lon protease-like protein